MQALARLRCDVVGIDASAELIEVAKKHATRDKNVEKQIKSVPMSLNFPKNVISNNVSLTAELGNYVIRYENADLSTYAKQYPEAFDLVVVSEVLEHVTNKEYFLKLCAKCLRVCITRFLEIF